MRRSNGTNGTLRIGAVVSPLQGLRCMTDTVPRAALCGYRRGALPWAGLLWPLRGGRPRHARKPIGVATYRIVKRLPKELKGQLPSPEEIAKLLEDVE